MSNIIEIQNLMKVYDNNYTALDKVNLSIKKGEIIALLAQNGAGKTSLISNVEYPLLHLAMFLLKDIMLKKNTAKQEI